jgi:AcrR family transcriptional regulator
MRRERTRRKLLAAAMTVFAAQGLDTPVIDDFIAAAGVARGTFYNYFKTTQELLAAVTCELSDEIVRSIEDVVAPIRDPLKRLATGCLIYMHLGVDLPIWGGFVMRTSAHGEAAGKLAGVYLPRDLELAREAGEVKYTTLRAAQDLVQASLSRAIHSVNAGHAPREHLRAVLALVLRGLGVSPAAAARQSGLPLPEIQLPEALVEMIL